MVYAVEPDSFDVMAVQEKIDEITIRHECWVIRLRPDPREIDIRPFIRRLAIEQAAILLDFWITPGGTARPDEVLRLLGLEAAWLGEGRIERRLLELRDELPPERAAEGPDRAINPARPLPRGYRPELLLPVESVAQPGEWGASPNGPVVE